MKTCVTENLYNLHRERLLNLIQSKVEDVQKAEDLLHDSFIKLQTCCESGCECERPKSYLFRLVLNTVFDYFKKRKKHRSTNLLFSTMVQDSAPTNHQDNCDLILCVNSFLNETTLDNRIAYEQVDLLQQSQVDVAKALNIPLPTLKSRVQRTRKFLKGRIEDCCQSNHARCI